MTLSSSPMHYPQTSSPAPLDAPRKRRKLDHDRQRVPLQDVGNTVTHVNKLRGGFQDDSDSEEDSLPCDDDAVKTSIATRPPDDAPTPPVSSPHAVPTFSEQHIPDLHSAEVPSRRSQLSQSSLVPKRKTFTIRTASGKSTVVLERSQHGGVHYSKQAEKLSIADPGKAQRNYYGIDIHRLVDVAKKDIENRRTAAEEKAAAAVQSSEPELVVPTSEANPSDAKPRRTLLWTEKYRARKFTDLVGDERTHRQVLRWLKGWDATVFPGASKPKQRAGVIKEEERPHRKILMLTGPPGLGKTTLAHVCAKQAGYEVQEINASDERSASVVKNRIRDMVATENVRSLDASTDKAARPVCVIVDEVDGVVTGASNSGNGEGGFIKALVDLLHLDQRNSNQVSTTANGKRKGDQFRLLRPIILICNDVYHPSLRLLRTGNLSETIHVRKPAITMVAPRMQNIFAREGVPADSDAVRQLCEVAWGVTNSRVDKTANAGVGEGDIRSILVIAEWAAAKLRACTIAGADPERLTKRWLATHLLPDLSHGGDSSRSLGRGGTKEVVDRVFLHNAGFPAAAPTATSSSTSRQFGPSAGLQLTHADIQKRAAFARLAEMSSSTGDEDRIMTDLFTSFPSHPYQDTTTLTKPTHAYEWLHFHSLCSSAVHAHQTWEMAPYLSYPVLAFHNLFASATKVQPQHNFSDDAQDVDVHPLTTARAPYLASESTKANNATLTALHASLSLPLQRSFKGPRDIATDLVPYLLRFLAPDVKPVVIAGQASVRRGVEKERLVRGAAALIATGVRYEKVRVEDLTAQEGRQSGGWAYRMVPAVDELGCYGTGKNTRKEGGGGGGYAVRAALNSMCEAEVRRCEHESRQRRAGNLISAEMGAYEEMKDEKSVKSEKVVKIKRDFFGRPVKSASVLDEGVLEKGKGAGKVAAVTRGRGLGKGMNDGDGCGLLFMRGIVMLCVRGLG